MKRLPLLAFVAIVLASCGGETVLEGERSHVFPAPVDQEGRASLGESRSWRTWEVPAGAKSGAAQHLQIGIEAPEPIWRGSTGSEVAPFAAPLIDRQRVYTLTGRGLVRAFNRETGAIVWSQALVPAGDESIFPGADMSLGGGLLFVAMPYGDLFALKPDSGEVMRHLTVEQTLIGAPIYDDGQLIIKATDGAVIAIDSTDGSLIWTQQGIAESFGLAPASHPVLGGDLVIAALRSGEVVGMTRDSGELVWSAPIFRGVPQTTLASLTDIAVAPAILGDVVYVSSVSGETVALDRQSGERIWAQKVGTAAPFVVSGGSLFLLGTDGSAYALDRETGDVLWRRSLPGEDIQPVGFTLADRRLWVFTRNGPTITLSARDGLIEPPSAGGIAVARAPVATQNGIVVLGIDGSVTLLR